jgi:hypothetical protein
MFSYVFMRFIKDHGSSWENLDGSYPHRVHILKYRLNFCYNVHSTWHIYIYIYIYWYLLQCLCNWICKHDVTIMLSCFNGDGKSVAISLPPPPFSGDNRK